MKKKPNSFSTLKDLNKKKMDKINKWKKSSIKGTLVTFILDESGSMMSCHGDTIGGYNSYISTLKKDGKDILFSLTKFDTNHITKAHDAVKMVEVVELTEESYRPGAGTPLYDVIGKVIGSTGNKDRNIICVILTDGEENSSSEYSKDAIKKLVEAKTKAGWTFVYLGANQDAWKVGGGIGIQRGNIKNYDTKDMTSAFGATAMATCYYSSNARVAAFQCNNVFQQDENDPNLHLVGSQTSVKK